MKIRTHLLPVTRAMIGGLASDPINNCLWLGLGGSPRFVWRFDLATRTFHPEIPDALTAGYSYVHRSIVPRLDGTVNIGLTWVMGIKPRGRPPQPFSPGAFARVINVSRVIGSLMTGCRILERAPSGVWSKVRDGRFMSIDLLWDAPRERLLRLMPRGVNQIDASGETTLFPAIDGFVHELAMTPGGQTFLSDGTGNLWLTDPHHGRISLGPLDDLDGTEKAMPGVDGLIHLPPRYMVGGTRNRARPFVIDLETSRLTLLDPTPSAPRASALAASTDGTAYMASGVGTVELHRIHPDPARVETLGRIQTADFPCHHLHDMVQTPDGRLFGGEFYPLDVPHPPWPERDCVLWEIEL